ncbi:MAG TPA: response regulator [Oceanospirillaceae bacterium]|jgi:CheY-like chemotaxis protein|nr:response regulator [Oceanospirillaceae bacterium]
MPQEPLLGEACGVAPLSMLVVEDNQINLEITKLLLTNQGHRVTAVDNGAAAVAAVSRQDFDLVLMDVRMKNINGLVATRQIRALSDPVKSAVEIFALTGDVTAVSISSCMEAGMDAVLSKPLRLSDLHHCLSGQW